MHVLLYKTWMRVCYWSVYKRPSFVNRSQSQVASFIAKIRVIYSALVDNSAMVDCFFEHQLTGLPFKMKIKLNVDIQLSLFFAQLESE